MAKSTDGRLGLSYLLEQLGFSADKRGTVVLCGLDNAGKARCCCVAPRVPWLACLRRERVSPSSMLRSKRGTSADTRQCGIYAQFCGGADGIVFMIDAADSARFEEAGENRDAARGHCRE